MSSEHYHNYTKHQRLYVDIDLSFSNKIVLGIAHSHYIRNVLRMKNDSFIRIFNNKHGEYLCKVREDGALSVIGRLREPVSIPHLSLGIPLIKPRRFSQALDMSVQLGVTDIYPMLTNRSQVRGINIKRYERCVTEAAEQCERLCLPQLHETVTLDNIVSNNKDKVLVFCDIASNPENAMHALSQDHREPLLLIGPEGGFDDEERKMLLSQKNLRVIKLHNNVLRAETAVATAIAQYIVI